MPVGGCLFFDDIHLAEEMLAVNCFVKL